MNTERDLALRAVLAELRAEYVLELPGLVQALADAIGRGKHAPDGASVIDEARSRAHKLCGTAGSYGFATLAEAAGRAEAALEALAGGDSGASADAWDEADRALSDIRASLAQIRSDEV